MSDKPQNKEELVAALTDVVLGAKEVLPGDIPGERHTEPIMEGDYPNQYTPWEEEGITEPEYFKRAYLDARKRCGAEGEGARAARCFMCGEPWKLDPITTSDRIGGGGTILSRWYCANNHGLLTYTIPRVEAPAQEEPHETKD